jgi:hypothetical protein
MGNGMPCLVNFKRKHHQSRSSHWMPLIPWRSSGVQPGLRRSNVEPNTHPVWDSEHDLIYVYHWQMNFQMWIRIKISHLSNLSSSSKLLQCIPM